MGNLHSVAKALSKAGAEKVVLTDNPEQLLAADRIVFPGVGALRDCIDAIKSRGLDEVIRASVQQKPVLGICLGMQALFEFSEENNGIEGLGLIKGSVRKFQRTADAPELKIPHMGWNEVYQSQNHPLWGGIAQNSRFYFVHSYYVDAAETEVVSGRTEYGITFTSAVAKENLFAVQFHPEKSQVAGLRLLTNFLQWNG
jgi:glutamine amidotransferase